MNIGLQRMFDERMLSVQIPINEWFESMENIDTVRVEGGKKNLDVSKASRR
jgi:hypothetical protein